MVKGTKKVQSSSVTQEASATLLVVQRRVGSKRENVTKLVQVEILP